MRNAYSTLRELGADEIFLLGDRCDEIFRASAYLPDNATDPATAFSEEVNASPLQRAFNTDASYWDLLEQPENILRFRRFGLATKGTLATQPPAAILQGWFIII